MARLQRVARQRQVRRIRVAAENEIAVRGEGSRKDVIPRRSSEVGGVNESCAGRIQLRDEAGVRALDASSDLFLHGSESGRPVILRYRMTPSPQGSASCIVSTAHGYEVPASAFGVIRIRGLDVSGGRTLSPTLMPDGTLPEISNGLQVFMGGSAPGLVLGFYQVNIRVPASGFEDWVPLVFPSTDDLGQSHAGNAEVGLYVSCPAGSTCARWP